jgi:hypothetical protein
MILIAQIHNILMKVLMKVGLNGPMKNGKKTVKYKLKFLTLTINQILTKNKLKINIKAKKR